MARSMGTPSELPASPEPGRSQGGDLVVLSNRGPAQLRRGADGSVITSRARGGLASSLAILLNGTGATWICAAMGDDEREIVASGDAPAHHDGVEMVMICPDPADYAMAYEVVSNSALWFTYHDLFDKVRRPVFDDRWHRAWSAYRNFSRLFADEAAQRAAPGATVLVQDYHLHLVASFLKEARPDLTLVHFVHTPFCNPSEMRVLPESTVFELISSLALFDACGFHTDRWCRAFVACCKSVGVEPPPTFTSPMGVDEASLHKVAATDGYQRELEKIVRAADGRCLVVRVDRMELSKNILRGFLAFDRMLEEWPELRGQVTFLALAYPSRESLAEYRSYRAEIETVVQRINTRWSPPLASAGAGLADAERDPSLWRPIILEVEDFYPRSVAAMSLYDVLLVNPVRDGLNLVAKEGPLVNTRGGTVILSREAGVWEEMSDAAVGINPFDLAETARAMGSALTLGAEQREKNARALAEAGRRSTLSQWLADQRNAAHRNA